jgi:hypothetical protein
MGDFETELIDAWLKTNGFLTRLGLPSIEGASSIIASRTSNGVIENLHLEKKVRFIANSYLCGTPNVEERNEDEIKHHAIQFVDKFFKSERLVQARNRAIANADWIYVLVVGEVRSAFEVECLKDLGVQIIDFKEVVNHAITNRRMLGTLCKTRHMLSVINYVTT